MKTHLLLFLLLIANFTIAQVHIGSSSKPDPSSILELTSNNLGLLPPRLTESQLNSINNPTAGLFVYCSDCKPKGIYYSNAYGNWINTVTSAVSIELSDDDIVSRTGRVWYNRNLGASQVATSSTDTNAFGGLFQWGRLLEGHEQIASSIYAGPVSSSASNPSDPWYGSFITISTISDVNWLDVPDYNLWNGLGASNNPCPAGYRLPTKEEFQDEISSWSTLDAQGAYDSSLKLPLPGIRNASDAAFFSNSGRYWSSSFDSSRSGYAYLLHVDSFSAIVTTNNVLANGYSVRCIKD